VIASVAALLMLAGPGPAELLEKVDQAAARASDAIITMDLEIRTGQSDPLQRRLRIWQLGRDKRMVKFLGPARLRGTGILVPRADQTYLYLPAYKRVRRVVGAKGSASFMGTGFSIDDLARVKFTGEYRPALAPAGPTDAHVLKLTPIDPAKHRHAWLLVTVRRDDHLVTRIETFGADGKRRRTIETSDFKTISGYTVAHTVRIEEHLKGRTTTARITEARFDTGLSASDFRERNLTRAP